MTPKQLVRQEKIVEFYILYFFGIKEEVIFMLTKGGRYLLARPKSINYTHKTVKHNTLSFSTVGYWTI